LVLSAVGCVLLASSLPPIPLLTIKFVLAAASTTSVDLFDPTTNTGSVNNLPAEPSAPQGTSALAPGNLCKSQSFSMQPATIALSATTDAHFVSSDGHLRVDVPAGALTADQIAADGGATSLLIRQILPASGSTAGGSGEYSFGTYLVQVLDASGRLATHGLTQPVTTSFHYGGSGIGVDVMHSFAVVNASLPNCVNPDPASVSVGGNAPSQSASPARLSARGPSSLTTFSVANSAVLGASSSPSTSVDPSSQSLSTPLTLSSPSTSISWDTNSPIATFGRPDQFEATLSGGSVITGYPIDVPAGPAGFKPPLTLAYDSAAVSDQHNPQGSAPWLGEGWNMSLGAITWSESNVNPLGTANWENTWQLSDAYGTSSELVPPTATTSIYYDDTGNLQTTPVQWHSAPETHARIYSFQSPNPPVVCSGSCRHMPCFRVYLPSGLMEEFGCTTDSLDWYIEPIGTNAGQDYIASWLLDLITDPNGNQVHITYQADDENGYHALNYPRDVVMSTVEWDSPTCQNSQTGCTSGGAAPNKWAPLMRVSFSASAAVSRSTGSNCPPRTATRCDEVNDLSGSGGLAAPTIENSFVLNDMFVQVRASTTSSWNTLRDYQLSYDQTPPGQITDPVTGKQESVAGRLLLTRFVEVGDDGSTAYPTNTFAYTAVPHYYEDSLFHASPSTNCGPSWNVPCNLWSASYEGNNYYLTSASNGLGLAETFAWQVAHDNMHGPNNANALNPFYCNTGSVQNTYPCYDADDETWSRVVLTQKTDSLGRGDQGSTVVQGTTNYSFQDTWPLAAQECSDCVAGYSWGNQNDSDFLDFYNGKFLGFAQAGVGKPDGSVETHKFWSTEGWGLYDTTQVSCLETNPCHKDPWWDFSQTGHSPPENNAAHGHEYEVDYYDTNGTTLLKQVKTGYQILCPPTGVAGSPALSGFGNWNGNLVSDLDHGNPLGACSVDPSQVDVITLDGTSLNNNPPPPHRTTAYAYDSYGRTISKTDTSNDGSVTGSPTTIVNKTVYVYNDAVTATQTSVSGLYLIDFPALADIEDSSATRYQCTYDRYDGHAYLTGQTSSLTKGLLTEEDRYTACGNSGNNYTPSGPISTTKAYDSTNYGNLVGEADPDANAGVISHRGCTVGTATYSICWSYDSTFIALAVSQTNALGQVTNSNYQVPASATAAGGFGLWPVSTSDVNSQSTGYGYDFLGRQTGLTLPGETSGITLATSYTVWCTGTGAQAPCAEVDRTQRLNKTTPATYATYRAFYNGLGQLVETRSPAPNGQDVVQYRYYDSSGRLITESVRYFVAAYTGGPGSAAYSTPDANQAVTRHTYDGLDRTISTTDALSHISTFSNTVICGAAGTGDPNSCYEQAKTVDALGHQSGALTDSFGRTDFEQRFTGNSGANYALYATSKYTYDYPGDLTRILQPNGVSQTIYAYDMAGRKIGMTDPDRGSETYTYDQDGNLTQLTDARGAAGTVYVGFDGIDRPIWRNTSNTPTGAYDTYSYDSTANGNVGIGRLTGETFSGAPSNSLSGGYAYAYDVRGQQTTTTLTVGSSSYPVQSTYDDAGAVLTQTYPDGETVTNSYTAQDWLSGVSTTQGNTTLMSNAAYTGTGGANGLITDAILGPPPLTYEYNATYDPLARLTDIFYAVQGQTRLFEQTRTFDAAGNVSTASTTLPAGTDNQAFCYDEQNRLTWAGSVGTPPCTGVPISAGSLTSAQYTQSFSYDNIGRLIGGPLGTYTYGDSSHVHAATAIGSTYTAAYDSAGDMTCRAPAAVWNCGGMQTGAQLTYNNEGQLSKWQSPTPQMPTSSATFLYDGQGNRAVQQSTSGSTTTTTVYVGALEEDATTSGTTTKTTYYYANGIRFAMAVNGSFSYLASDGLGSANVTLANGTATASMLYAPYGSVRYSSGSMPTDRGFTGQVADPTSGLDYYGARYYDPVAGQFSSADTLLPGGGFDPWGLSRYAYVEGNPILRTDPTGHIMPCPSEGCGDATTGSSPGASSASKRAGSSGPGSTNTNSNRGTHRTGAMQDLPGRCGGADACIDPANPALSDPCASDSEGQACISKQMTGDTAPLAADITSGAAWFHDNAPLISTDLHRINGAASLASLTIFPDAATVPIAMGTGIAATGVDTYLAATGRAPTWLPLLDAVSFGTIPSMAQLGSDAAAGLQAVLAISDVIFG
jgi:RHS repeat-associated protein